jgi:hypothetical protein
MRMWEAVKKRWTATASRNETKRGDETRQTRLVRLEW